MTINLSQEIACIASGIYVVAIKVLPAEPRLKKGRGEEPFKILAALPIVAAPPSDLPRLVHNTTSYAGYQEREGGRALPCLGLIGVCC